MRILVFHGYMLRGTGSNIYNVNLARALAKLGHEVHLLCQDRETKIEGVEIHNPDIGGLLPVYVKDPYEGFEVKAFPELTEAELAVWRGFLRVHTALARQLDAELDAAHGIPLSSYEVLINLQAAPDRRFRMADLADRARRITFTPRCSRA